MFDEEKFSSLLLDLLNNSKSQTNFGNSHDLFIKDDKHITILKNINFNKSNILYINKFDIEIFIRKTSQTENIVEITESELRDLMYQSTTYENSYRVPQTNDKAKIDEDHPDDEFY